MMLFELAVLVIATSLLAGYAIWRIDQRVYDAEHMRAGIHEDNLRRIRANLFTASTVSGVSRGITREGVIER